MTKKIAAFALAFTLISPNIAIAREPLPVPAERTASLAIEEVWRDAETGQIVADIVVDPKGQSINAVFASLDFATSSLVAKSLDFEKSFCELFIDESFDNESGKISIMCGKPYPGVDAEAIVGRVTFERVGAEETTFSFSPESIVLANDGYGTDVLATTTTLNIQ